MRHAKDIIEDLRKRARIRRQIPSRKSVQLGEKDRLSDQLDEAADALEYYYNKWLNSTWT